ncbi:hypothetical protein AB0O34_01295 [Sphaerisporangium sp. NPDC088356]|uniref:hypothetical protein n=1 Tax=Sphaerisporangium sp. NPDC088356 TaxID=3154871 RepID=UPI00342E28CA
MDGVRVSLAGMGFGLIIAGCLGTPVRLSKITQVTVLTSEQRVLVAAIGLVTVLLMLGTKRLFRPLRLRHLTALLFSTLVGAAVAFSAGALVFPALAGPARSRHDDREGEWRGFLDYPESGGHSVHVRVDSVERSHVVSGRLVIRLSNGKCVFVLRDSEITPGRAMSMDFQRAPGDEACAAEDGAELRMEVIEPGLRMKLDVVTDEEDVIATGVVTRTPDARSPPGGRFPYRP